MNPYQPNLEVPGIKDWIKKIPINPWIIGAIYVAIIAGIIYYEFKDQIMTWIQTTKDFYFGPPKEKKKLFQTPFLNSYKIPKKAKARWTELPPSNMVTGVSNLTRPLF